MSEKTYLRPTRVVVNLYAVSTKDWDWSIFVFASTGNKAKSLSVHCNDDEEYVDLRYSLLKKDVGGKNNAIVTDQDDEDYKRVDALGFGYSEVTP